MKKYSLIIVLSLLSVILSGCLKDEDGGDYKEWKKQNDEYLVTFDTEVAGGRNGYTKIVPTWAPSNSVYIKWHNDRSQTAANLSPLSNSTVNITYALEDIEGTSLGDSFSNTANGDSIYQSKPNQNIVGMWAAMLEMHAGDSVTMVIPYISGYGARIINGIKPYSNLIYHVKMKEVVKYEY